MVSVKDLQDVVDDLKVQAGKRASDLLGESRSQVRSAIGGHSDGTLLGTFAVGIILGAIVGAALSLLFTPMSGQEARRRLGENVEKMRSTEPSAMGTNGNTRPMSSVGGQSKYVSS
jgi:hypothetical protein